ncbi:hypothetical protein ACFL5V_08495 [Fibrobacterota bacterium]
MKQESVIPCECRESPSNEVAFYPRKAKSIVGDCPVNFSIRAFSATRKDNDSCGNYDTISKAGNDSNE